jgi:superfamily II DNA/RNA helicase
MPAYGTRPEMAFYITAINAKLQYLIKLILQHWLERNEKMIIFANEPMSFFQCELLLAILQLEYTCIRAGLSYNQRSQNEVRFVDNPKCGILLVSAACGSESMNLQRTCHVQVHLEPLSSTNTLQCIGRCHRLGQEKEVKVYRLMTDGSYDDVMQAAYHKTFREQVAAGMEIREEQLDKIVANLNQEKRAEYEQQLATDHAGRSVGRLAAASLRMIYADHLIRELFGQRSVRTLEWNNALNPGTKIISPFELIYRICFGGDVANEAVERYRLSKAPKEDSLSKSQGKPLTDKQRTDPRWKGVATGNFGLPLASSIPNKPFDPQTGALYLISAAEELCDQPEYIADGYTPLRKSQRNQNPIGLSVCF